MGHSAVSNGWATGQGPERTPRITSSCRMQCEPQGAGRRACREARRAPAVFGFRRRSQKHRFAAQFDSWVEVRCRALPSGPCALLLGHTPRRLTGNRGGTTTRGAATDQGCMSCIPPSGRRKRASREPTPNRLPGIPIADRPLDSGVHRKQCSGAHKCVQLKRSATPYRTVSIRNLRGMLRGIPVAPLGTRCRRN
jgi:hypothetical protein